MDQNAPPARDHGIAGMIALDVFLMLATAGLLVFAVLWQRSDGDFFGDEERQWPVLAPAFSADDLSAEPTKVWLTNGGTLANQRYSPLDADRHRQRRRTSRASG